MKKVLKNKNYMLLALGSFISNIGDQMYNIALTIGLYSITGDILSVAYMWLIRASLRIPTQFFAGIISDKLNKKYIITFVNYISCPIACLLVLSNYNNIYIVYIIVFLLQSLNDAERNAAASIVAHIVPKEDLTDANSGFTMLGTVSTFIAPAISGIIYKLHGVKLLYLINGITFIFAAVCFTFIKYAHEHSSKKHEFTLFRFAIDGYKQLFNKKIILSAIIVFVPFAILGRYYDIFKVYVTDATLNFGPEGIVYFGYAMSIGGLLTPKVMSVLRGKIKNNNYYAYIISIFITSIMYICWIYSDSMVISFVSLIILSLASSISMISLRVSIQSNIDKEYLGRVFSLQKTIIIISAIIGIVLAPITKNLIGVELAVTTMSIIGIICVIWYLLRVKTLSIGEEENETV